MGRKKKEDKMITKTLRLTEEQIQYLDEVWGNKQAALIRNMIDEKIRIYRSTEKLHNDRV